MKLLRDGPRIVMALAAAMTLAALLLPERGPAAAPASGVGAVEPPVSSVGASESRSALRAPARAGTGGLVRVVAEASRRPLRRRP